MHSEKSLCAGLFQRSFKDAIAVTEFSAYIDERRMTRDGICRNDHSFDELMWISLHEHPILAGPGLTLVGVTAKVDRLASVLRNKAPLQACRKPRTAATAQAAGFGHLDNFSRTELL